MIGEKDHQITGGGMMKNQNGISLIEVLITLVVVAVGLLAITSLQGTFMSATGTNKARVEAMNIAEWQTERLRNILMGLQDPDDLDESIDCDFNDFNGFNDCEINEVEVIVGTNATFTVTNNVPLNLTATGLKNVVVDVDWKMANNEDDNVRLITEVARFNPLKNALTSVEASTSMAIPSPRQSASEDVRPASETLGDDSVISPTPTPLPMTGTVSADETSLTGLASSFNVLGTDNTNFTLERIADDSRYYSTGFSEGVLGVYLCLDNGACRYIQNHFGGVSLSTSGKVFSVNNTDNNLSGVGVVWSSSEVTACYTGPVDTTGTGQNAVYSMEYECVYAGNCAENPSDCHPTVTVEQVIDRNVGPGGEFGNLGLIGLDGGNGGDQLCFLEDTPDWNNNKNILSGNYNPGGGNFAYNETYLLPVTTRSYVSRRMMSNGLERSEGINQSFRNHNFVIVNRVNSPNVYKNCFNAVNENETTRETYVLPPREIVRVMNTGANTVGPITSFNGVMPAITLRGTVSGARSNLYIPELGSCYVNNANSDYACVVPKNFAGEVVDISGGSSSTPGPGNQSPPVPVSYRTCIGTVDETQATNFAAGSTCNWPF